jgi:alginate O-acetyltransferase complex protein AlgI
MLFNSLEFLIFFPIVCYLCFLAPHSLQPIIILIASCIFYAAFIPVYLLILFAIIVIDYYAAIKMNDVQERYRRYLLVASIGTNLLFLAIFKYYNFILSTQVAFLDYLGISSGPFFFSSTLQNLILPIGLSFHTFQAMSYTIEVYRRNQQPERNILYYALYVMYFPQLVAGPIERPQNLLNQLTRYVQFDYARVTSGLRLMLIGFMKKVLIADRLAILVDQVYGDPMHYGGFALLLATYFFSLQIYCDFSGYSDIARGAAKVLGVDLMMNFDRPYLAESPIAFWRRWHISLSTWFRDYIFIPLGSNSLGINRLILNLIIVFLISGLWHGAQWTFVLWGLLHGCLVGINHLYRYVARVFDRKNGILLACRVITCIKVFFTFHFITLLWVFFRAESF